jgi:hypothetical protein
VSLSLCTHCTRRMEEPEEPVPQSVLAALDTVRFELQGELELFEKLRSGSLAEVQTLGEEIESRQRQLELVDATLWQLAGQGQGQPDLEGGGPGASTQVRGWDKAQDVREAIWLIGSLCPICDSRRRWLPSSGPVPRRLMKSLSPSPRGPSPRPFGGTTCCRC